jgi:uncharacterized protein YdeI (YjbR/CyaY-like superfamily)
MAKRPTYSMPADVRSALSNGGVAAAYKARPRYQQNDYIGWIARSKLPATRDKRIRQMVAELKKGGVYMGMEHGPSAKT